MRISRALLTVSSSLAIAVALSACSPNDQPRPAVTVTVNATPTAAAEASGWLGEEPLGASMYVAVFLSWVDDNGQLTGQMQGAYPSSGGGSTVTVANASLVGTRVGNQVTVQASSGGSVFGWSGSATGSVTSSELDLEGGMLSSFLPSEDLPEGAPQLTLKPATASDFENAIGQLNGYIQSRKQNEENGCPESGCTGG